ncbi:MAG TPA: YdeI/OmpD-associated family protein [Acidobacteriaceae bacterium]|nr:YdeI/OmpD-associated family protein [Acidobacteriaceae bacterium]
MKRYRFEAAIQRSTGWGAFVFFPHDTQTEFGIKGRVPVQARLGGIPYTGSLMPRGEAFHLLAVPHAIMEQLNKKPGDLLEIDLWRDDEPRTVELPEEFTKLLCKEKLLAGFEKLPLTRRKEYRNWIASAKREETRQRRLAKAVERLRSEVKTRA